MPKASTGKRGTWEAFDRLCTDRYHTISLSQVSKPETQKHLEDWCDGQEVNSTHDLM